MVLSSMFAVPASISHPCLVLRSNCTARSIFRQYRASGLRLPYLAGLERKKLPIHLDVMAWDLFRVPASVNRPATHVPRQPSQTISDERTVDTRVGGLNSVVAFEVPSDSLWAEVIRSPEV
jgi:hypothetical protein